MKKCKHIIAGRIGKKSDRWHQGGSISYSNGLVKLDSYECINCGKEFSPEWKTKNAITK